MPEGPEIRRVADVLSDALVGRVVRRVQFRFEHMRALEPVLQGERVARVDTWGKALLTCFENGLVVYSHNQLYGRWYVCAPDRPPETGRELRLGLYTDDRHALLYSASEIDVLEWAHLDAHPFLAGLGPDVLWPDVGAADFRSRLDDPRFAGRGLGALLLDQSFAAGLGNYLRAEILFVARLHPALRPADCPPEALDRLAEAIVAISQRSYRTEGVTLDPERARELRAAGAAFEDYRFWVFGRDGRACYVCGAPIERISNGGRRCYVCAGCQNKS